MGEESTRQPTGIIPALSTTTTTKGELDEQSLRALVRQNIKWGVHGLAVSIVAGEFYKFSDEERKRCFEIVVDEADGKCTVWAGISHMGTEPAIQLGRYAKNVGADGIVAMPALVGRDAGIGQEEHFGTILERIDLPLMIQDAEDFSGVHIRTSLYAKLAKNYSNLVSVKVEGGDTLQKIEDIVGMPEASRFTVIGGMAARLLFEELERGARGNIPDSCLTDLLVSVYENYTTGRVAVARKMFARYRPWVDFLTLHSASSAEVEKETLRLRGIIKSSHTRSPHVSLAEDSKRELASMVKDLYPAGKGPR